MARGNLNGIEIDYEATGAGPVVLLSHGYSATRRMWDDQHRALGRPLPRHSAGAAGARRDREPGRIRAVLGPSHHRGHEGSARPLGVERA